MQTIKNFQKIWGQRKFNYIKYTLSPDIDYTESGKGKAIYLVNLESKMRGKGHASNFLKELCSSADISKTPLSLIPDADTDIVDSLNQNQLENFYKKFGFTPTKIGDNGTILEMLRNPK